MRPSYVRILYSILKKSKVSALSITPGSELVSFRLTVFSVPVDSRIFIFIGFIVIVAVIAYFGHLQAKKRREAFERLAMELGFRFAPQKDTGFAAQYGFLEHMDDGHRRYAFNRLYGTVEGQSAKNS